MPLTAKEDGHHHWTYAGSEGPERWGDLSKEYATCKIGQNQSPVDIPVKLQPGSGTIETHYDETYYKLENNGHTLQASVGEKAPTMVVDGNVFTLKQFHFHTPSEHTFKGEHYPMEIHFVHQSSEKALAVLAVVVKEGAENPDFTPLIEKNLKAGEKETAGKLLNVARLIPNDSTHFRLTGSLTTPPCSEGVSWIIFETPITASKAQIDAMRAMTGSNNRPVQPLNSRTVAKDN
ncbi:MAG TPA: carbonic anhydrase [Pasteurellaceae bacterium]|nr:carbonic anhydrase [Pasteurellaceae bacterium]